MSDTKKNINGLRVVVAGGASAIGSVLCKRLASNGAKVIVGDINETAAKATAAEISSAGGNAIGVAFDFSNEDSVRDLIGSSVEAFGGLDGLVNMGADLRAETIGRDFGILDMDPAVWRRTMDVNLIGYALTTKHALPKMFEQGGGSIINISSVTAWMADPGVPAYAAAKAAVHAMTRHTAHTGGPKKVRANAVSFGIINTEPVKAALNNEDYYNKFIPTSALKRVGELEEACSLVEYLLSREATFITGQVWGVNGGVMMRE
ncbi:hypothetical protein N3K66_009057 [Trichothecium roseum]|uniref:Uncharacterized protein n=1 Tax=Trichothecium roseum TaxID=47278 RepID=A0ACC0URL2_9HYPO|nr:hypothetical protein N3K66_009057 [Trichothecium roseum]